MENMQMDIYEKYEEENKFSEEERVYYILTGKSGGAMFSKSKSYYIISCTLIAAYDTEEEKLIEKPGIIRWPISIEDYKKQDDTSEYFNTYKDGVIYKVVGKLEVNNLGDATIMYVKKIIESDVQGSRLDEIQEKYHAPIVFDDEILGKLSLEKDEGLFKGEHNMNGHMITIYIEVEWNQKKTWEKPLEIARSVIRDINNKDQQAREYAASDEDLFEAALGCVDEFDCEISFSNSKEFAEALKGRLKYVYIEQSGSYTMGYDDGEIFGGHEIDIDVDEEGRFVCAEDR